MARWDSVDIASSMVLHIPHSSVARRLEQLGRALSIDLTGPTGLTRARVALTARRLLDD